jgi:sec-independent protein translocase protein TatA
MGAIGVTELLVIAGVAVLLFGGSRIADLGKGMGQAIKNFKQGVRDEADAPSKGGS